jgi:hypothetical protein
MTFESRSTLVARWQWLIPVILDTWEVGIRRPQTQAAQGNSSRDPHLQNNQSKMDWRCASRSRKPALQTQSPEFNHSPTLGTWSTVWTSGSFPTQGHSALLPSGNCSPKWFMIILFPIYPAFCGNSMLSPHSLQCPQSSVWSCPSRQFLVIV